MNYELKRYFTVAKNENGESAAIKDSSPLSAVQNDISGAAAAQ